MYPFLLKSTVANQKCIFVPIGFAHLSTFCQNFSCSHHGSKQTLECIITTNEFLTRDPPSSKNRLHTRKGYTKFIANFKSVQKIRQIESGQGGGRNKVEGSVERARKVMMVVKKTQMTDYWCGGSNAGRALRYYKIVSGATIWLFKIRRWIHWLRFAISGAGARQFPHRLPGRAWR